MNETHAPLEAHHEPGCYEIRLKGHLDDRWANWFEGLTITREDNGDTRLTGPVADQAALHGLLRKVRDCGYMSDKASTGVRQSVFRKVKAFCLQNADTNHHL